MVFFEKNILIPNVAEKNILILVEEKKIWFKVFVKNKYSYSCVVRKKNSERNKKP
jgi:hypothetical protein